MVCVVEQGDKSILVNSESILIIFYRNPELGKVKTRLAATMGDEKALEVYLRLVNHTRDVVDVLSVQKIVYYSHHIETDDVWEDKRIDKAVQQGDSLGDRMQKAFESCFEKKYKSVCIIGTDCFELTSEIIKDAFESLKSKNAVIGPAVDGGYYLLGMNQFIPEVFINKAWSTAKVMDDTIRDLKNLKLTYHQLPILRDVDHEKDLPSSFRKKQ